MDLFNHIPAPTIKLRPYQQDNYDALIDYISKNNHKEKIRILNYLPTGGGKSILIAKTAHDLQGRTLILTNRVEILIQNSEWLNNYGTLTAKKDDVRKSHNVVIAMVETLNSRIKTYGINYIGQFDNIIVDEAHILSFDKVYEQYNYKVLIGFTGTPILNKKEYKTIQGIKYSRQLTFSTYYDGIIETIDSQDLIDLGYLVQDYNVVLQNETDKLKASASDPSGYTVESLNDVYANSASVDILLDAYEKYGVGKKTIIFNPTTKVNRFVYDAFIKKGIEVRLYDTKSGGDRSEVINWFKQTKDGVLINANVFTTGFNEKDIECVIVNRATKSMSLWVQMIGRGSRISDTIFKDKFTVIDLGDNIFNHEIWSARRTWKDFFYPKDWKSVKSLSIIRTWDCVLCGAINPVSEFNCCNCDNTIENNRILLQENNSDNKIKTRSGQLVAINKAIIPQANKIIEYAIKHKKGVSFALKLAEAKIVELFVYYKVSKEFYFNKQSKFKARVKQIYLPIYFAIIKNKELHGGNRKLDTMLDKLYNKIDELFKT